MSSHRTAEILAAADRLVSVDGWETLTMRRLAAEVGVTAPVIYDHFAGKEAVIGALVARGFRRLRIEIEASQDGNEPLRSMGRAYLRFARNAPHLYPVMMGPPDAGWDQAAAEAASTAAVLRAVLASHWPGADPEEVDRRVKMVWSSVHGVASLLLAGRLDGSRQAEHLVDGLMTALAP